MMEKTIGLFLVPLSLLVMALPSPSSAAGPGSGSYTLNDVDVDDCHASSLTVKWDLDSLMGEPTVSGSYKWAGDESCQLPSSTTIWLKVADGIGNSAFVKLSPATRGK